MEIRGRMELTSLNFLTLAVGVAWVFLTAMAELISTEAQWETHTCIVYTCLKIPLRCINMFAHLVQSDLDLGQGSSTAQPSAPAFTIFLLLIHILTSHRQDLYDP